MISSPGIRTSSHSALKLSGARGPGTLRGSTQLPRLLFREPRDKPRGNNSQTFHAAPASRSRRVAGPRGVHAYSVPPVILVMK